MFVDLMFDILCFCFICVTVACVVTFIACLILMLITLFK